ncbi:hypothetical protein DAQ1742_02868 [Dickeya aquatica]|uniref:Uncharacterized protein n=1 Tax=Dickeya aquatica TaxID=1401087 RepID=A0A375AC90_9GAMM|nr:hypothetical protein DAQ1742_02868 [Dickeya aquatica]
MFFVLQAASAQPDVDVSLIACWGKVELVGLNPFLFYG